MKAEKEEKNYEASLMLDDIDEEKEKTKTGEKNGSGDVRDPVEVLGVLHRSALSVDETNPCKQSQRR